jgi:uncharacterized protein YdaU (DUF1376 family)
LTTEKCKIAKTSFVIPFTQFDWGDYYSDTDYLSFEEHGTYWNLMKRYYTTGPFENDIKHLKRVTKCPNRKMEELANILEEFFFISDDGCWHHKRCDEEIIRAKGKCEIQSQRARKGMLTKKRDVNTGLFVSENSVFEPAAAGSAPAIKIEDEYINIQDKYINNEYSIRNQDLRQRRNSDE